MENDSLNRESYREYKSADVHYYVSLLEGSCLVRTGDSTTKLCKESKDKPS